MPHMKNIDQENESYVLPSNNEELKSFIFKYKVDMTEQVISSIEFAIKHKLPIAEIFQFKGSKFVVTVSPKEFDCNLTREIVDLIDREADMLNRGRSEISLEGLRKRLSNLFL